MSTPLILGGIWVLLATVVAMLPMRLQFIPGAALLFAAPILIGFIAYHHGFWIAGLGLFAFLSMFRRPLIYYIRRALGKPAELPQEMRKDAP